MTEKGRIKQIKREPVFNSVICVPWWCDKKDFDCSIGEKLYIFRSRIIFNLVDSVKLSLWIV